MHLASTFSSHNAVEPCLQFTFARFSKQLCRWVVVPWNFFAFNVLTGGSEMYGSSPWHWNFTAHAPTMLSSFLPLLALGLRSASRDE